METVYFFMAVIGALTPVYVALGSIWYKLGRVEQIALSNLNRLNNINGCMHAANERAGRKPGETPYKADQGGA